MKEFAYENLIYSSDNCQEEKIVKIEDIQRSLVERRKMIQRPKII